MTEAQRDAVAPRTFTWNRGEVEMQRHAGVAEKMAGLGPRIVRDYLPDQHRTFYQQLPSIVAGVVDESGNAWATVLCGIPGFIRTDLHSLHIGALAYPGDPAASGIQAGSAIGLLGIDLSNRRRNRANGVIEAVGSASFDVDVIESYGNCPQYIHTRVPAFNRGPQEPPAAVPEALSIADPRVRELIVHAESFFIASYWDNGQDRRVDVSHKGGNQGFVKIDEAGHLLIPDYAGNRFFNTLGNIRLTPQCGLAFVNFANGDVLQITGEGTVILDPAQLAGFEGAERLLRVEVKRLVFRPAALPLRWTPTE